MNLNIRDITYDSVVDGFGIRTVIWFQGCNHHCKNCHNPETWSPEGGTVYSIEEIAKLINKQDKVTLSGGDPLFQIEALDRMLGLVDVGKDIWLYTGYTYDELSELLKTTSNILNKVSIIKTGPFIEELKDPNLRFRGSSNQEFYKIDDGKIYNVTELIDSGYYK